MIELRKSKKAINFFENLDLIIDEEKSTSNYICFINRLTGKKLEIWAELNNQLPIICIEEDENN